MRTFLLFSFSFLISHFTFAQSPFPDPIVGTRPEAFSSRSLGLGRTFMTAETGAPALLGNPATLAASFDERKLSLAAAECGPWLVDLSGDVTRVKESRSYPYYDSFEGVLGYNNYAINDHLFSKLDIGLAWLVPQDQLTNLVLSGGSYSTYRFDYRYHEEVRNRYSNGGIQDMKLGDNRLDVNGDLRSLSLGAAAQEDCWSMGVAVSMLTGNWTYNKQTLYTDNYPDAGVSQLVNEVDYSTKGMPAEFNVGLEYQVSERVALGGRALIPTGNYKFNFDGRSFVGDEVSTASGTTEVTYPAHYGLGVEFHPQHEFRPRLFLEGEIHTYRDVQENYDNTFEIRAAAEQQIMPGSPVRLGFVYYTAPDQKDRANTFFTAGIGFHIQRLTTDFGVEVGKINYNESDRFPQSLFGDTDRTDNDRVETALFRGLATLKYSF